MRKGGAAIVILAILTSCGKVRSDGTAGSAATLGEEPFWRPVEGGERVGVPAPEWDSGKTWLRSAPIALSDLRGKVVLLRFWLAGCPYCVRSAPALQGLHERFAPQGLVVIGFHHPKAPGHEEPEFVRSAARDLGFTFPIALDNDWEALRKYWFPNGEKRKFTSVSFLIDGAGVIRWLHDGGEYHEGGGEGHGRCEAALRSLENWVKRLLKEGKGGSK